MGPDVQIQTFGAGLVIRASKKTRQRRRMVLELDRACRERVFERDNFACVRCGSRDGLQWCHVVGRRNLNLRWEDENSFCGCSGCHLFWHHEPILAIDWFRRAYPHRYEMLTAAAPISVKVNVRQRFEALGVE